MSLLWKLRPQPSSALLFALRGQRTLLALPIGITHLAVLGHCDQSNGLGVGFRLRRPRRPRPGGGRSPQCCGKRFALRLLVPQGNVADGQVLAALGKLRQACWPTVASAEMVRSFTVEDLVRPEGPARLPVRCP